MFDTTKSACHQPTYYEWSTPTSRIRRTTTFGNYPYWSSLYINVWLRMLMIDHAPWQFSSSSTACLQVHWTPSPVDASVLICSVDVPHVSLLVDCTSVVPIVVKDSSGAFCSVPDIVDSSESDEVWYVTGDNDDVVKTLNTLESSDSATELHMHTSLRIIIVRVTILRFHSMTKVSCIAMCVLSRVVKCLRYGAIALLYRQQPHVRILRGQRSSVGTSQWLFSRTVLGIASRRSLHAQYNFIEL